jgi:D-xylose reductase
MANSNRFNLQAWWMDEAGTVSPDKVSIRETWESLEELVDSGIAKSIGVSNFQAQVLYDMLTYVKHPISSLQIEHHPYLVQGELVKLAQENKIVITAYSSFGPQSFRELPPQFSQRAKDIPLLFDSEIIQKIATDHKVTPAKVLLRWATQRYVKSANFLSERVRHTDICR